MRWIVLLCAALLMSCGEKKPASTVVNTYAIEGQVMGLDAKTHAATIKHSDIKDAKGKVWMEAMTMEFPIKDQAEFNKLKVGDKIRGTVSQKEADFDYWVGDIKIDGTDKPAGN